MVIRKTLDLFSLNMLELSLNAPPSRGSRNHWETTGKQLGNNLITKGQGTRPASGLSSAPVVSPLAPQHPPPSAITLGVSSVPTGQRIDKTRLPFPLD